MRRFASITISLLSAVAMPQLALAQSAAPAGEQAAAEEAPANEIIVTGSRLSKSTFNSPTPVTVISGETIQSLGQVNIGETIQSLPQNISKASETNTGIAVLSILNAGSNIADLRGLNPNNGVRTLTLVDTRRFVPSTSGGAVDLNLIPSMLVKSVETVTGGASAAYGTDALAGVVNVILDKQLNGIKAQIDYGQTFRNDGASIHASMAAGTGFAGGRGHVIFGGEYQKSDEVGDCVYVREWCASSPDNFVNEANGNNSSTAANNGLPRTIRDINGAYTNYALSSVIRMTTGNPRNNPLTIRGLVFSPDGKTVRQYDAGRFTAANGFGERQGGECLRDCSPWAEVQLRPEIKRLSLFSHVDWEFSPKLKGFIEGSYGTRESHIAGLSLGPSSGTPIRSDYFWLNNTASGLGSGGVFSGPVTYFNQATGTTVPLSSLIPAIPTQTIGLVPVNGVPTPSCVPTPASGGSYNAAQTYCGVSQAVGVPTTPIFIAKMMKDVPGTRQSANTDLTTWRVAAGLDGELDFLEGLKWNAYYQYGKTTQDVVVTGNRVNRFFMYALDAVDSGLAQGLPATGIAVCRATLPGPANLITPAGFEQHWNRADAAGCVPLNILGTNTEDPRAIAYAYRDATEKFTYDQHVAAFNVSGDIFKGWAGPIGLALGGEYRYEKGSTEHNTLPFNVTNTNSPFGNNIAGSLKIWEGYAETNIPLLRDLPLIDSLELNAAYRRTHQTNSDAVSGNSKTLNFSTWKLSGTWDVTDWVRFRATRSRDVRAASFTDLYTNFPNVDPGPPAGGIPNGWTNAANISSQVINDFATIKYPANFALTPEIGDTFTAGIVLQPKGPLEGLRLSVDYYKIDIKKAIGVLTANDIATACYVSGSFCENLLAEDGTPFSELSASDPRRVVVGGVGGVGTVIRGAANIGTVKQAGWDVELLYGLSLDQIKASLPGKLTLRGMATINEVMKVDQGVGGSRAVVVDYHNQTGGSAFAGFTAPSSYILTGYATYDLGGFSMTWDAKYIPTGIYDVRRDASLPTYSNNSINDNTVPSRLYVGLSTSYKFALQGKANAEVFLSVRNLFDVDPPATASNTNGSSGYVQGNGGPTNPVFYDTLGARWRAGVRVNF